MTAPPAAPALQVLRHTRGVCTTCLDDVDAQVVSDGAEVRLEKHCPRCGVTTQRLSGHPEEWAELDAHYFAVMDKELPQRDYILRLTETCNLDCPICLARANTAPTPDLDAKALEPLLARRGRIKIDFMAAEPTLRADLEEQVRAVKARGHIAALHTNGLKLANRAYAERIAAAGVDEVFLQFDGLDDEANRALRGRPLNKARLAALANLRELGLATSLIVVIGKGVNEAEVGRTLRFALQPENTHIREVFFMGLRTLGGARDRAMEGQALMPDDLVDLLCAQEPRVSRRDVRDFNLLYFSMLSAVEVKKCLYVQHYLLARGGPEGFRPIGEVLPLGELAEAARAYRRRRADGHPTLARAGLAASLARAGLSPDARAMARDLLRLEELLRAGMNLQAVPPRFLLIGFITACDPANFDAQVAINCGKGELSVDGGLEEAGAVANVRREQRVARSRG